METAIGSELTPAAIQEFKANLRGTLLDPQSDGYDVTRRVWNGMIDRRPGLIARCAGVSDVIRSVNFARMHNLRVSVRGGGHNVTGNAVCDGGLMIDLSPMKGIHVDPAGKTVRAEAGVTWRELDHETQAFGLATTGGTISTTGIAGLTLGGGVGYLMRRCGLAIDNLISADVVTADGQFLTASESRNSDLFWGLRGGGGNFGIVTSMEYRLHEIGPIVTGGMLLYPVSQAPELLRFLRDYLVTTPDEFMAYAIFLTAPPAPFIPEHLQGTKLFAIAVCHTGTLKEGEEAVAPLRAFTPPAIDMVGPMPYTAVQQLFDAGTPPGLQVYLKSDYFDDLSDEVIEVLVTNAANVTSPMSVVIIFPMGGAVGRVAKEATAFSYRDAGYDYVVYSIWADPSESERHIRWTREFGAAMQPFSTGVYVNELGNEGEDRVRAAYGNQTYQRLVALKNRYDPTNFFRLNQNIRPTLGAQGTGPVIEPQMSHENREM
jgi:FAD/FMN-containing dehydrogenase